MDLTRIRDAIEAREFDSALKICAQGMKEHPEEKIAYILLAGHALRKLYIFFSFLFF